MSGIDGTMAFQEVTRFEPVHFFFFKSSPTTRT
jgi:hypothetical protein